MQGAGSGSTHVNLEFQDSLAFWSGLQGRMKAGLWAQAPHPLFSPLHGSPSLPAFLVGLRLTHQQHCLPSGGQRQALEAGVGHLGKELRDPRLQLGSEWCPSGWASCGPVGSSLCGEGPLEKSQIRGPSGLGLREEKASNTGPSAEGALEEQGFSCYLNTRQTKFTEPGVGATPSRSKMSPPWQRTEPCRVRAGQLAQTGHTTQAPGGLAPP